MRIKYELQKNDNKIRKAINKAGKINIAGIISDKNPSAWKDDIQYYDIIKNRLGWLNLPLLFKENCSEIKLFADEIREEGFEYAVVLGMGGSSMCPEVCKETFGIKKNYLKLYVLDSTDPGTVSAIEKSIELSKTLFIVSSKSGGTIEVDSFFRYFFEKVRKIKGDEAGNQFIAITDPSTVLEERARVNKFRKIFINPPDIGGRYSALSYFGLVPAALMGINIQRLLADAEEMMKLCFSADAKRNAGIRLGVSIGELAKKGKDKLTFILQKDLYSFGFWVEQLIAESTGKEGKGIVPVEGEKFGPLTNYGKDRVFLLIYSEKNMRKAKRKSSLLKREKFSEIDICIKNKYSLGGMFYLWEYATAVMGYSLKINPFDEPNVSESKDNTGKVLEYYEAEKKLPEQKPVTDWKKIKFYLPSDYHKKIKKKKIKPVKITSEDYLKLFFRQTKPDDYIALMAYLQSNLKNSQWLGKIREMVKTKLKVATTLGYGPRFLHSTGQLHKGGKDIGMFIQIISDDRKDLEIPDKPYTFSILKQSQALGDYESLLKHKRRVLKINVGKDPERGLKNLCFILEKIL